MANSAQAHTTTIDASGIRAEVRNSRSGSPMWSAAFAPGNALPQYLAAPVVSRMA